MDLIVDVGQVARRLGLERPLSEDERWTIEQALTDAQADLEAYLGRPVMPRVYTETGLIRYPAGFNLIHSPVIEIISETPETHPEHGYSTGRYTVVYRAGLSGATDPELEPLRRFVRSSAIHSPMLQRLLRTLGRDTTQIPASISVEGQSISYEDAYGWEEAEAGSGAAGALPTLASCDRWRRRSIYQRRTEPGQERWWPWCADSF